MINVFFKLTSGFPVIRKVPEARDNELQRSALNCWSRQCDKYPAWIKLKQERSDKSLLRLYLEHDELRDLVYHPSFKDKLKSDMNEVRPDTRVVKYNKEGNDWSVFCSFLPWVPQPAYQCLHRFCSGGRPLMCFPNRLPDRLPGLSDINRIASAPRKGRVQSFGLQDAIIYSYCRDTRFVCIFCLMIGFSVWWFTAPLPLLHNPAVLTSPDLPLIIEVFKDTFHNKICSTHHLPSPCECGEPLNKAAMDLLKGNESFDPLGLLNKKAGFTFLASILLCIALSESVSSQGVLFDMG